MEAVVTRVIIKAFKEISNCHQNFEMKHIYEIVNLAKNSTGKKINLTNNIICKNSYGDLIFKVNEKNIIDDKISEVRINKNSILNDIVYEEYNISFQIINNKNKVEFSKNNLIKLFDYDKIEKEIIIRHRRDGDKIIPLGMKGNKKLKDIFIDMKIPREKRDEVPILCFDEKIAWVVGYKTSQESRITQDTKNILKITFDRKE